MNKRLYLYIFSCWLAALLFGLAGGPGPATAAGPAAQVPIHIEADKMISQEQEKAVVFSGNVRAKQGELLINSDEMTVYHGGDSAQPAAGAGQPQIDKMHARGHVEIVQDDFVATGDEAEYYADRGKVVIVGNAKIIQNNNMVTGHRVEMDLDKGSTVVVPDKNKKGRVVGYFYPAGSGEDDQEAEGEEDGEGAAAAGQPGDTPPKQEDAPHGDSRN